MTSNVQTKAVARLEDHPVRRYFDEGVIVVPCTDNPLMSNCTLSSMLAILLSEYPYDSGEYALWQEHFHFAIPELVRLIDNGFCNAFLSNTHLRRLRAEALNDTVNILQQVCYSLINITICYLSALF